MNTVSEDYKYGLLLPIECMDCTVNVSFQMLLCINNLIFALYTL